MYAALWRLLPGPAWVRVLILIVLDGVLSGRRVSRFVRERHPDTALSTWSMGFYAFSRASMIRRFRTPRPQVNIGDNI